MIPQIVRLQLYSYYTFPHCSKNFPIMSPTCFIPNSSRKLLCLQVASLPSRWYLHFLLISGGFGAFAISSSLVHGYRLRQLPIANNSYAESNPPFLSLNYKRDRSGTFGSQCASTLLKVSCSLARLNAFHLHPGLQFHLLFFCSKLFRGWSREARSGTNFPQYCTSPRNERSCYWFLCRGALAMASTFLVVVWSPSASIR